MKITSLFLGLFLLLSITGCENKESDTPSSQEPPLEFSLLYDTSLQDFVKPLVTSFQASKPTLNNGQALMLSLFSAEPLDAMRSVADGRIKADLWLTSSDSYLQWANNHLENLGAAHKDCQPLFSDSISLVVRRDLLESSGIADQLFPLENSSRQFGVSLGHLVPGIHSAGIFSTAQMLLAIGGADTFTRENFRKAESHVSFYVPQPEQLLSHLTLAQESLNVAAVPQSTLNLSSSKEAYAILEPKEGSYLMNHQVCHSTGDWVTPPRRVAAEMLVKWLRSPEALAAAQSLGYTPPESTTDEDSAPRPVLDASQLELLSKDWKAAHRRSTIVVVADRSGSVDPIHLSSAQRALRYLFARRAEGQKTAVITVSTEPKLEVDFSTDVKKLTRISDELYPLGGSALYDSIRFAYDQFLSEKYKKVDAEGTRKIVLVISDGGDQNSRMRYESVKHLLQTRSEKLGIQLIILALPGEAAQQQKLKELAEAAAGIFIETSGYELEPYIDKFAL